MKKTKAPTPNDQRSVVKNKNNVAFTLDKANTKRQIEANQTKKKSN